METDNYHSIFMVYCSGRYLYFNNEPIQTRDVLFINATYGSSRLFGSRISSTFIKHKTHIGRRSNFCSKPTPKHGLVHKS